jgi:ubiquinone/menaquinone biosynthesis C-methylase UbiE
MSATTSVSEDNGISVLTDDDLDIYSVGISTGGVAEIRMAKMNPKRHIVATTIDEAGAALTRQHIIAAGFERQIDTKIEDVSQPLNYKDSSFDYVYARLVLHYLPKHSLESALSELYRILKPNRKLYIVVRSTDCPATKLADNTFDPASGMTTYTYVDPVSGKRQRLHRFFHTEESIKKYVSDAGFHVAYAKSYDEHLYADFAREVKSPDIDNVIELTAVK